MLVFVESTWTLWGLVGCGYGDKGGEYRRGDIKNNV